MKQILTLLKSFLLFIGCCLPLSLAGRVVDTMNLFPLRIDGQMVFVDKEYQQQIFHAFDMAEPFEGNVAWVRLGDKEAIINKKGEWVVKPEVAKLRILDLGGRKLILVKKRHSTRYEVHKWKLMPSIKRITSSEEPFFQTKVSYQSFQLIDEDGDVLWTLNYPINSTQAASQNPFCVRMIAEHLFLYEEGDGSLPIPEVKYYRVVDKGLKHKSLIKGVWGFTKEGLLIQKKKDIFLYGFDGLIACDHPFLYKVISNTNSLQKKRPNTIIWRHREQFKMIDEKDGGWIEIPSVVVAKGGYGISPLDAQGQFFLVHLSPLEVALMDKKGGFKVHPDELQFVSEMPQEQIVVFKKKQLQHYFVWNQGVLHPLPAEYLPSEKVNDSIMILTNGKEFKKLKKYGVYDLLNKHWTLLPGNSHIKTIGKNRLSKSEYQDGEEKVRGFRLINLKGKEVGGRLYKQLWETNNPALIKAAVQESDQLFYIMGQDGAELKWE